MTQETPSQIASPPARRKVVRRSFIFFLSLSIALAASPFRDWVRDRVLEWGTLANNSPTVDSVREMIKASLHPNAAISSAWDTGKIVHRRAAIGEVDRILVSSHQLPAEFESLVLGAAFDPDLSVREVAFRILRNRKHPALVALAAAQLTDCDPDVRLLGLDYLRRTSTGIGISTMMPLLDDTDPLVAAVSLKLVEKWSQQNFGVKGHEITPASRDPESGLRQPHEGSEARRKAGTDRAKAWWAEHRSETTSVPLEPMVTTPVATKPMMVRDFELPTLDGRAIRLSNFRGKVVVLNFWTTGCASGLKDLTALQQKAGDRVCVLGVSLENVPDSHGHRGGHEGGEHHEELHHDHDDPSLNEIREKVARAIKDNGVNFTVLLDEDFKVGGSFNAGELPSTVIIDAQGFIRRRFTERRTLAVLEAMVAEANQPMISVPVLAKNSSTK